MRRTQICPLIFAAPWISQKNTTLPAVVGVNVTVPFWPALSVPVVGPPVILKVWGALPPFVTFTVRGWPTFMSMVFGL